MYHTVRLSKKCGVEASQYRSPNGLGIVVSSKVIKFCTKLKLSLLWCFILVLYDWFVYIRQRYYFAGRMIFLTSREILPSAYRKTLVSRCLYIKHIILYVFWYKSWLLCAEYWGQPYRHLWISITGRVKQHFHEMCKYDCVAAINHLPIKWTFWNNEGHVSDEIRLTRYVLHTRAWTPYVLDLTLYFIVYGGLK